MEDKKSFYEQVVLAKIVENERAKNQAILNKASIDYKRELELNDNKTQVNLEGPEDLQIGSYDLDEFKHL